MNFVKYSFARFDETSDEIELTWLSGRKSTLKSFSVRNISLTSWDIGIALKSIKGAYWPSISSFNELRLAGCAEKARK